MSLTRQNDRAEEMPNSETDLVCTHTLSHTDAESDAETHTHPIAGLVYENN